MRPASGRVAAVQASVLAKNRLSGVSYSTKKRRVRRAAIVAEVIWVRWRVGIWQWKLKHVRWLFEYHLKDQSANTRYQYWLAVRDLLKYLGKAHWAPQLQGQWTRPG